MLVITRRLNEEVILNHGEVVIEILEIRGKTVKLAFKAAKEISIQRGEAVLHEANQADEG